MCVLALIELNFVVTLSKKVTVSLFSFSLWMFLCDRLIIMYLDLMSLSRGG